MKGFFESIFKKNDSEEIKDKLFFIKTENILTRDENKSGVIVAVELDPKYKFYAIKLEEKPIIVSKKRGISKVMQDLRLVYGNPGAIMDDLQGIKNTKKGVSILHIDQYDNCFLYGEHKGLEIVELTEKTIILEGEESDSFFEVDFELSKAITEEVAEED